MFTGRTTAEWIELSDKHGVWAGPVYDYQDLARDPHVLETGMFIDQPHAGAEQTIRTSRPPIRMSATPPRISRGAPVLGADTIELLAELGYAEERIEQLIAAGAVADQASNGYSEKTL